MINKTILVVDDEESNLYLLNNLLSSTYDVKSAYSAQHALNILNKIEVDLILLDIQMPEMDGFEMAFKLKEDEKLADIPIIFLTAQKEEKTISYAFNLGAEDYITKPFLKEELKARVHTHLKTRELQQRLTKQNEVQSNILINQARLSFLDDIIKSVSLKCKMPISFIEANLTNLKSAYLSDEMTQDYFLSNVNRSIENIKIIEELVKEFNEYFSKESKDESFNIIVLIKKVLDILNATMVKHAIYSIIEIENEQLNLFDIQYEDSRFDMYGKKNDFMQVLINILNNAKESICERFETVSEFPEGLIKINLSVDGENDIKIEIHDNGLGLNNSTKERMFEPYFSTKDVVENSGIGLYMCKKIIEENMNSTIDIINNEDDFGAVCILNIKKS